MRNFCWEKKSIKSTDTLVSNLLQPKEKYRLGFFFFGENILLSNENNPLVLLYAFHFMSDEASCNSAAVQTTAPEIMNTVT